MKRTNVDFTKGFQVLIGDEHSQAATLVIQPGKTVGSANNRHGGADQWIYVESGSGVALINGHSYPIERRALMLVQRGDGHEFRNTGSSELRILSFYLPPAYDAEGEELPAGMP